MTILFLEEMKRKITKTPWTPKGIQIVLDACHRHIIDKTTPGKSECLKLIEKHPELSNREWKNIKDYVRNHTTKLNRQPKE